MAIRDIPEDNDGRTTNSALGQRNRGAMTRMSIDMTKEQQKEFLIEAVEHNMTLRGYFYHCWRNSQRFEELESQTKDDEQTPATLADAALARAKKKLTSV